LSAKYAA